MAASPSAGYGRGVELRAKLAGAISAVVAVGGQLLGWGLLQGGAFDALPPAARSQRLAFVFAVVAAASLGAGGWAASIIRHERSPELGKPALALVLGLVAGGLAVMFLAG